MDYKRIIFDIIKEAKAHPTAEDIYLGMKQSGEKAVLATVYNNLKTLLREGKIRKVVLEGYPDRYELNFKHDHKICSSCGRIEDVVIRDMTEDIEKALGENIQSYDLKISYTCQNCKERIKSQETDKGSE